MKSQITITWNPEAENETTVTYSGGWQELSSLERLDNLKDALAELEQKYNTVLETEGVV